MSYLDAAILIFLGAMFVAVPILMVRGLVQYYRSDRSSGSVAGGIAGAMNELDRITRPSIQHVEEVDDEHVEQESIDGE